MGLCLKGVDLAQCRRHQEEVFKYFFLWAEFEEREGGGKRERDQVCAIDDFLHEFHDWKVEELLDGVLLLLEQVRPALYFGSAERAKFVVLD